jgi:hypothetical protein
VVTICHHSVRPARHSFTVEGHPLGQSPDNGTRRSLGSDCSLAALDLNRDEEHYRHAPSHAGAVRQSTDKVGWKCAPNCLRDVSM